MRYAVRKGLLVPKHEVVSRKTHLRVPRCNIILRRPSWFPVAPPITAAVGFDTSTAITNENLSVGGTITKTNYMTLAAGATFLLIGIDVQANGPPAFSVTWNAVSMTSLGTFVRVAGKAGTDGNLQYFGIVSPATGAHNLVVNGGASDNFYLFGISFTGTETSSVAAATTAYTTNTGTSTTMSVTSGAAIPSTAMAVAYGCDSNGGYTNAGETFFTTGTPTQIGQNQSAANNDNAARVTGTGSTMTASGALAASDNWGILVVGIVVPGAALTLPGSMPLLMM